MKRQLYIFTEKCVGCKSCELACAVAHSQSKDLWLAVAERPSPEARIRIQAVRGAPAPLYCRHCKNAPCVQVCPTGAMSRPDPNGPVLCQSALCTGCGLCVPVCPFGVLRLDREGKVIVKCDLCVELQEDGREPACVTACPTLAIRSISDEETLALEIVPEKCTGCGVCARRCPQKAISGERKQAHMIDQQLCIQCGLCRDACKFGAIRVTISSPDAVKVEI